MQNLILCGGIFHDFEATSLALADELAALGVQSTVESDIEKGIGLLAKSRYDLLTINALRWEMVGDKYDPYREREAFRISDEQRSLIRDHVDRGGALLALHTASICFSDWPEWSQILGGAWVWGQSWHPSPCAITVSPATTSQLQLQGFEVVDELYSSLSISPQVRVELVGECASVDAQQPLLWCHQFGQGRVVYDSLGHDAASIHTPAHADALRAAVAWSLELRRERHASD